MTDGSDMWNAFTTKDTTKYGAVFSRLRNDRNVDICVLREYNLVVDVNRMSPVIIGN